MTNEATCRGSIALGSACMKCSKCKREMESLAGCLSDEHISTGTIHANRKPVIKYILYGERETKKPMQCYHVGLLGCVGTESVGHGLKDNIPAFSYSVHFEDGSTVEISRDTFYVCAE